ncbi:MAG: hypothetical protein KME33_01815 [Aetokthonos hydrillicola CCALA 1050]|nr:hypothetical protein [Aetokthonos hydrillicola CCALA 1050]
MGHGKKLRAVLRVVQLVFGKYGITIAINEFLCYRYLVMRMWRNWQTR